MNELRNSKSDDQLEELLLLTEQMQEELDQKDRTIRELKVQLDESLTLNEKLNSENKTENIQALKNDLRKTKELLQSEKEKTHTVQAMIEECRDKQRQAEQERDYALSHQKKVEIPVEKPVLYQKCGNCKQTAYLKAKEKYDMQREKLAGRYKTKTAMYEALMFEIYLVTSIAPIPVATMVNREWGGMGQNYLKSLLALGFQAFLILVCVGIYAVLIQTIAATDDISGAIWSCMGYTVLLCFTLFKTGSLAKSVFSAH